MLTMHAPGNAPDLNSDLEKHWTWAVSEILHAAVDIGRRVTGREPWFVNGVTDPLNAGAITADIDWEAYPKRQPGRFAQVDGNRQLQDEYCEWSVARQGDRITRITFSTETPDYYIFLSRHKPELLLALYHKFVSADVRADDLVDADGNYDPTNRWNVSAGNASGTLMHMAQDNNTFGAAASLSAVASWPAVNPDGNPVVGTQELIACLGFGVASRHSDPHIGAEINNLIRSGNKVTVADPVGLYIHAIHLDAFETPDGSSIMEWHRYERGDEGHRMRVVFEAPQGSGHTLSDLLVDGEPLRFGGQVAQTIRVRIRGLAEETSTSPPEPVVCAQAAAPPEFDYATTMTPYAAMTKGLRMFRIET